MSAVGTGARRLPLVLRNPSFGRVWAGQLLTQAASRMFQVGAVWWLVGFAGGAHRGLDSGLFLMVSTLPAVALAPVVARVIARHAPRTVLACAAAVAGLVAMAAAVLAQAGALPMAAVYAVGLALAACQALFDPCLTTSVPQLVDDADIEAATGFELSTQSVAGLGGGLLGPLIVDTGGLPGVVAACAAAYLLAALLVRSARFPHATTRTDGAESGAAPASRTLRQVLAGLPFILRVLLCFAAANVFTTAVYVVMPLYTRGVLHSTGSTVASLEAALGVGTLVGSFTGARVPGRPVAVGSACLTVMAVALGLPGLAAGHAVAFGALAVAGWCVGVIGVRFVALFQRLVPAGDKPEFFAAMQALLGATFPVASLVFGALGDHLTARTLCLVQGAGLVPVALALWWLGGRADSGDVRASATQPLARAGETS
ncbi:putative MFS family arabinose efflux permease [Streptomyces griseochromogenes]|uniref:MFS family arabinose efflux permease n=1 Tax=Streptomyces griseochromogenes TaxID=68214 RepID=A0A1B1B0V6_9ACTN|nr:MFS transporter [Streptomyces griseochromogenes]ANP52447.1 MFS transporter [Streptomyces griseochromogenes]MBP2055923.1 putative MFS family arabinose efflux permease [Streptomyces griseochromogenes]